MRSSNKPLSQAKLTGTREDLNNLPLLEMKAVILGI